MKKIILFTIAILSLFNISCKKWQHEFPEDGERTKKTPTERLCDKWWVLDKVTLNGQDYTDSIDQIFGEYKVFFTNEKLPKQSATSQDIFRCDLNITNQPKSNCGWKFPTIDKFLLGYTDMDSNITNRFSIIPAHLHQYSFFPGEYIISKLTESEFKITISSRSGDSIVQNYFKLL